jgi:hypothetical protein
MSATLQAQFAAAAERLRLQRDLWTAAQEGRAEDVRAILTTHGPFPVYTALVVAACNDHADAVRALLVSASGLPDVSHLAIVMQTAAKHGSVSVMQLALTFPASQTYFRRILREAANHDQPDVVRLLASTPGAVDHGTRVLRRILAASDGPSADVVRELVAAKADMNALGEQRDALHLCLSGSGRADVVRVLLEAKASANAHSGRCGETPLCQAARNEHADVSIPLLLDFKADVNMATLQDGRTPTILAVCAWPPKLASLRLLVSAKADVNRADYQGMTPVQWAARQDDIGAMRILIEAKADVDPANAAARAALL